MLADHAGKFETIQLRHANVDQNDRDLVLEQVLERIPAGGGDHEILAELLENDFIGKQLRRLIVDQQDIYLLVLCHLPAPISDVATCGWRAATVRC